MSFQTTRWDVTEFLDSDAAVAAYLDAVFEAGDPDEMRDALRHVARARGMAELAKAAWITRAGLYKALGEDGNPSFATVVAVLRWRCSWERSRIAAKGGSKDRGGAYPIL